MSMLVFIIMHEPQMYPIDVSAKTTYVTWVAPDATIGIMAVICNGVVILNFWNAKKCEFVDFVVWNIM